MNTKKDLKLIINLRRSPLLADAVHSVCGGGFSLLEYAKKRQKSTDTALRFEHGAIEGWDSYSAYTSHDSDFIFIDAATEFGKLAELLEKPEPKVIPKVIAWIAQPSGTQKSYDGYVKEDGSGISVGCSFVPREKVKEAYEALFGEVK